MFYYRSLSNWRKHQAFMKRCLSILAVGLMPVIFVQAKENCSEAVYAQSQQQRTVTVKGTVTDADGVATLNVPQGASVEVSMIGYATQVRINPTLCLYK